MKIKKILLTVTAVIFCGSFATAQIDRVEQLDETEKMAWFWSEKDQEKEAKRKEKNEKKKAIKDKKKAEKKAAKKRKKEKALQIKKAKKAEKKVKDKSKKIKKDKKRVEKKAREEEKPKKRALTNQEIDMYVDQWKSDLADYQQEERSSRTALIENWKDSRKGEVSQEYSDGKYADLYKLPSWPLEALFADHKSLINSKSKFTYQTSAYDSNGSKGDLSNLLFSEDPIRLQDILLALKLSNNGVVEDNGLNENLKTNPGSDDETEWEQKFDQIHLIAESNEFRKDLNYSRYIIGREILVGFDIPIVYKRHYLKTSFHEYGPLGKFNTDVLFKRESYFKTAFEKVLALKDLNYNRKNSATGIGDINLFANCNIRSRFFEKANWGFKLQLPTSKDADVTKLWAPSLGEEFVKFSAHLAMLWGPRDWFNPHFLIQATYAASANVDRRIPKRIKRGDVADGGDFEGKMLLGDKVQAEADRTFSEWDTTVKEMADESRKVSLQPGPEFFVRVGNIFEKVLFRRMFLDLFCDFRAKFEDSASGLPEDDYDLRLIEQNTNEIEGLFGINFSYQFDYHTRLQLGGRYTFVGLNVPQTMELNCNLGIEF